ncbi:hypothetical protein Gotri_007137 [Gossypium trilobum]|uniref:DUF4283 domain-containing protein n=1 Tax=Gossypium trilobum TaxID=34281 RepID=A0A7J9EFN3_9ROSI|nr:hypothetical protein [Gossypium trilobum]
MDSLCDSNGEGDNLPGNPSTKKVCFKYSESNPDVEMVVDLTLAPTLSWKDLVLGKGPIKSKGMSEVGFANGKFSLLEGIPAIEFSDRVHKLLVKDMSTSVALKLLGRNIDFAALQNKVYGLWRPSQPFQLMDIENGYFLAKFQNSDDYEMVLSQVPWLIFKQYLTVQPWTIDFNPAHPYPSTVLAWIRFPGLSSYLYKKEVLWKFGGMVGKVTKLDFNTNSETRGRYVRMAVYVNLEKPLLSQVLINGIFSVLSMKAYQCGFTKKDSPDDWNLPRGYWYDDWNRRVWPLDVGGEED